MSDDKAKLYLDYLDKEMTIMGILSTFTVAAVAGVLNKLVSIDPTTKTLMATAWDRGCHYFIFASVFMLFSALYFYRQRSHLAWHYGQICLWLARASSNANDQLKEADSWETWIHYRWAFGFLALAAVEYAAGLTTASNSMLGVWLSTHSALCVLIPTIASLGFLLFVRRVLTLHKYDDAPFRDYWRTFRRNA